MVPITEKIGKVDKVIGHKKESIDAKRVDNLSWDDYEDDNMGRLFLTKDILVLDIDAEESVIDTEKKTVTIVALDLTIPYGLYTTTTQDNKYHFYYKADTAMLSNRIKGLHNLTIDIFTYGTVFEGHTFAPSHKFHKGEIIEAPEALLDSVYDWMDSKGLDATESSSEMTLQSNIQRFNLVQAFLADELKTTKQWNAFFLSVFPLESQPQGRSRLKIDKYKLSYDLFNKIAVKITTTKELDFHKHVVPTLNKLLKLWGINPASKKSQELMWQNILPSLPQHESIEKYLMEQDEKTLQEHLNAQTLTTTPIFRTIDRSKMYFIEIDKTTQVPIIHGGSYFLEKVTAQALHPERNIENEEGKVIGWDDDVPIVYTINNPYKPQYIWDEKQYRHLVNLYTPTEYITQAEIAPTISENNLIYKAVVSTIGPQYLELYLAYSAQVLFGQASPTMVLWMAALKTELGGSGKSVVTLELFSMILGAAAASIDSKTVSSGWGDIVTSTKILSLEDMPNLATKEWEAVYSNIKQQNTNSHRKLNMKGGAMVSERVSIAITGSTNHRLHLSSSDRRFLCLEPAHFHGYSKPLNNDDRLELARLLQSHEYDERVQEYVNYLCYIFDKGFSKEIESALFIEAPQTIYRPKWVGSGDSNSQNIIHSLPHPVDLLALCRLQPNDISHELIHLFEIIVQSRKGTRVGVSWKWFETILPYIQADKYSAVKYSKSSISKMLNVDFKNVGGYADTWRKELPEDMEPEWSRWPSDGYTWDVSDEEYSNYLAVIGELKGV